MGAGRGHRAATRVLNILELVTAIAGGLAFRHGRARLQRP